MSATSTGGQAAPTLKAELATITGPVQAHLAALETFLADEVTAFEPEIQPLVASCFAHAGKRLRPLLVFYGGWHEDEAVDTAHVRAAAVVELVHLATLVHDDILDKADLRHNAATVSAEHGADVAVLLGDALFSQALKLAAEFPTTNVCRAVASATRRVCAGEISQTLARGNLDISEEKYRDMIDAKTAELFRVSVWLGAFLNDTPQAFQDDVARFGHHLGMAYQIFDDMTDIVGAEERIGKTLGTDLFSGKVTLPLIYLREQVGPDGLADRLAAARDGLDGVAALTSELESTGIVDRVRNAFLAELDAADAALAPWLEQPAVPRLQRLAAFVREQLTRR